MRRRQQNSLNLKIVCVLVIDLLKVKRLVDCIVSEFVFMFAFVCGSKQDEGVGSDKENTPPPATSSPPWLKKRRLTPLSSPQDSGDDSDADILEGAVSVTSSVDNKHIRTVRTIRYFV